MSDLDYYKCPVEGCGEVISGETVVDPAFGFRMSVHKTRHDQDLVEKMRDSTLICALSLYATQAADPSVAVVLLEQMGVDGAEEIVLAHRTNGRGRDGQRPAE